MPNATRAFLVHAARRQTVEVRLDGSVLVVVNDDGEAAKRAFPSEAAASAELAKVIAAALAAGFVRADETLEAIEGEDDDAASGDDEDIMVSPEDGERPPARNPELEAAIVAAPEDPSSYEVYGDWLQSQGDPRGKLVAMQCQAARGNHRAALAEQDFRAANAWFLLGADHERISTECDLEWRFGFLRSLAMASPSREILANVLDLPAARFLRSLDLGFFSRGFGPPPPSVLDLFAAHPSAGPTATSLKLRLTERLDLGRLSALFPRLETLLLRADGCTGTLALPRLRELDVGAIDPSSLRSLAASPLPVLETLRLGAERIERKDLHPLLDAKAFLSVRHLALTRFQDEDALFRDLERAPLLARLATLDLAGGGLHEAAAKTLIAAKSAFAHLEWIELGHHRLGDKAVRRLRQALPNARFTERELEPPYLGGERDEDDEEADEDGERYDEAGE